MIRILRPESVTPLEPYLGQSRRSPKDYQRAVEFALVLLLREQEFVAIHATHPPAGPRLDWPIEPDYWAPYSLTTQGQFWLEADLAELAGPTTTFGEMRPRDLFGFKREAADRLDKTTPKQGAKWSDGIPVLFKLWRDLLRHEETAERAQHWATRNPTDLTALAYLYDAASLLDGTGHHQWKAVADDAHQKAAPLLKRKRWPVDSIAWTRRVTQRVEDQFTDRALKVRRRVEPGFDRFLQSERNFYLKERATLMKAFDDRKVPLDLYGLLPFAKELGVGDDPARGFFVQRMPPKKRTAAHRAIGGAAKRIDDWLATFPPDTPLPPEAQAFYWLREAGEELTS
jgi:hypothetical protein